VGPLKHKKAPGSSFSLCASVIDNLPCINQSREVEADNAYL